MAKLSWAKLSFKSDLLFVKFGVFSSQLICAACGKKKSAHLLYCQASNFYSQRLIHVDPNILPSPLLRFQALRTRRFDLLHLEVCMEQKTREGKKTGSWKPSQRYPKMFFLLWLCLKSWSCMIAGRSHCSHRSRRSQAPPGVLVVGASHTPSTPHWVRNPALPLWLFNRFGLSRAKLHPVWMTVRLAPLRKIMSIKSVHEYPCPSNMSMNTRPKMMLQILSVSIHFSSPPLLLCHRLPGLPGLPRLPGLPTSRSSWRLAWQQYLRERRGSPKFPVILATEITVWCQVCLNDHPLFGVIMALSILFTEKNSSTAECDICDSYTARGAQELAETVRDEKHVNHFRNIKKYGTRNYKLKHSSSDSLIDMILYLWDVNIGTLHKPNRKLRPVT